MGEKNIMKKRKFISILLSTLLIVSLISGCGKKDEEAARPAVDETAEEADAIPEDTAEEVTEEPEIIDVDAQELWDNAWNDVQSVTMKTYNELDLTVDKSILHSGTIDMYELPTDQEEYNFVDRTEHTVEMMKNGDLYMDEHYKSKYTLDYFNFSESNYNDSEYEGYYVLDGDYDYSYTYDDAGGAWNKYYYEFNETYASDPSFINDEPENLEVVGQTDTEWIVTGTVKISYLGEVFTYELLEKPEEEITEEDNDIDHENDDWDATDVETSATYTFDKATGHLIKAEYDFEKVFLAWATDFTKEGVKSINVCVSTVEYTNFNTSSFEVSSEIKDNAVDMVEYMKQYD